MSYKRRSRSESVEDRNEMEEKSASRDKSASPEREKSRGSSKHSPKHSSSASKSRSRSRSHHHRRKKSHRRRSHSSRRKHRRRSSDSRSKSRSKSRSRSRSRSRSHHSSARRRRSPSRSPPAPTYYNRRWRPEREMAKESRCIGVFGLNLDTGSRELRDFFSRYGPIDDIQVVYDYNTGKSRGFAFIYMKHIEDAIEAKEKAPGTELDGRKIRVDYSITDRAHTPTPGVYYGREGNGHYRSPEGRTSNNRRSRSYSRSPSYRH